MIKSFFKSLYAVLELMLHVTTEYGRVMYGVWRLSKLKKPIVTVLGGSKIAQGHIYAQQAYQLGKMLIDHDISVITGGGPGIMEAANCGAYGGEYNGTVARSVGIGVKGLEAEYKNKCSNEMIVTKYFFARKFLLTRYATAFVVFPGGLGTMDELFEVTTLMQTGHLKRCPIVLIDAAYWTHLLLFIRNAEKEGLLLKKDADLIFVTDNLDEAFKHLYIESKDNLL